MRMQACVATSRLLLIVGIVVGGCAKNASEPVATAESLTSSGWALYESGDFAEARSRFRQAIREDGGFADAYNGHGWSVLRLDSLTLAVSQFDHALACGSDAPAPLAGLAVAYRDLDPADFEKAIARADSALARSPRFAFSHDRTFDWRDLRLIVAQSCFALGRYDDAKAQVDSLLAGNTLTPESPTFVTDLLTEITELGKLLAGH